MSFKLCPFFTCPNSTPFAPEFNFAILMACIPYDLPVHFLPCISPLSLLSIILKRRARPRTDFPGIGHFWAYWGGVLSHERKERSFLHLLIIFDLPTELRWFAYLFRVLLLPIWIFSGVNRTCYFGCKEFADAQTSGRMATGSG